MTKFERFDGAPPKTQWWWFIVEHYLYVFCILIMVTLGQFYGNACFVALIFRWIQWNGRFLFFFCTTRVPMLLLFTGCNHFSLLNIKGNIVWDGHSVLVFDAMKRTNEKKTTNNNENYYCILTQVLEVSCNKVLWDSIFFETHKI